MFLLFRSATLKVRPYLEPQNILCAASVFHLTGLNLLHGLTESLVSLLQAWWESVSLDFWLQARWLLWGLKLHHRMVVVIDLEWSHPCRHMYRVIVNGLSEL